MKSKIWSTTCRILLRPLPSRSLAHEMMPAARGLGLVEKDSRAVFDVLARMSDLPGS